jgi:hypothetical protein
MIRSIVGTCALAWLTLFLSAATSTAAPDRRSQPMSFELRLQGPAAECGTACRTWVSATGAVTADTPRDFEAFAKQNDIRAKTIALDSDGGSVLGALALGRAIRRLEMTTTVGRSVAIGGADTADKRARLLPDANCESMCAFLLIAGVERYVPPQARVLVHQIWLGDRRDDPTAASYSAEDLVLVQRDIGRLAQFTVEMGVGIDLLETALRIPPWEPMRLLSRDELRGMDIAISADAPATAAPATTSAAPSTAVLANGARMPGNERGWVVADTGDRPQLKRTHPLTVEGDEIGTFDLAFACGEPGKDYAVTYAERRRGTEDGRRAETLSGVELSLAGKAVPLKIVSSQSGGNTSEFISVASGRIPADMVKSFAEPRSRSLLVRTISDDITTAIRVGNAGVARSFAQLAAGCTLPQAGTPMAQAGPPAAKDTSRLELRREAEAHPPR